MNIILLLYFLCPLFLSFPLRKVGVLHLQSPINVDQFPSNPILDGSKLGDLMKNDPPIVKSGTIEAIEDDKCYFSIVRKTSMEREPRPKTSEVSTDCSSELISMEELMNDETGDLLEAKNKLDLVLCRGSGRCLLDFFKESVRSEWKQRKICTNHIKELLTDWQKYKYYHILFTLREGNRKVVCSMPENLGIYHGEHRPIQQKRNPLNTQESRSILKKEGVLLHPGLPLCPRHKLYAENTAANVRIDEAGYFIDPPPTEGLLSHSMDKSNSEAHYSCRVIQPRDPAYVPPIRRVPTKRIEPPAIVSEKVLNAFQNFATAVGISGNLIKYRKEYPDMALRTHQRKAMAARTLIDVLFKCIAPADPQALKNLAFKHEHNIWTSMRNNDLSTLMQAIANAFYDAQNRAERINALSLLTQFPLSQIHEFIPGVSSYLFYKAKKFARRIKSDKPDIHIKERYNPIAVNRFIDFITSDEVMTGLPFGTRKLKLSDGKILEIPNTMRMQRSSEIIRMFEAYMTQAGEKKLLMSRSTMYRILDACSASKMKATTCVDYFIVDAEEAFEEINGVVNGWYTGGLIDVDWAKELKKKMAESRQYLMTDYRLHVKFSSKVPDHCARYALSDPVEPHFARECTTMKDIDGHLHEHRCDRCEFVKSAIADVLDTQGKLHSEARDVSDDSQTKASQSAYEKLEEDEETIRKAEKKILELKRHFMRATYTNMLREDIISGLKSHEALVTMDWAQKLMPMYYMERQSDYYGKRGISYHISHATVRIGDKLAQHSFVHIMDGDLQDSVAVTAILEHTLLELKKMSVHTVTLRSDNAGCYHSSSTLASLHHIQQTTQVNIKRYSFSEPQNGKSSCDRMAALLKRKVHDYVDSGHDVTTAEQFFHSLTNKDMIQGVSVYHGKIEKGKVSTTKIAAITKLNDFVPTEKGLLTYQYYGIGSGLLLHKTNIVANKGLFVQLTAAGVLSGGFNGDTEFHKVETGQYSIYWHTTICPQGQKCKDEPENIETEEEDRSEESATSESSEDPESKREHVFQCSYDGCTATYLQYHNLQKHVLAGKHRLIPDKKTLNDYAVNTFGRKIEEVDRSRFIPRLADAVEKTFPVDYDSSVVLPQGWALKQSKERVLYSTSAKAFLKKIYEKSVKEKKKLDPKVVANEMKKAKNGRSAMFTSEELLNWRQISSYLARLGKERKLAKRSVDDEPMDTDDDQSDEMETEGDEQLDYLKEPETQYFFDFVHQAVYDNRHEIFEYPDDPITHDEL